MSLETPLKILSNLLWESISGLKCLFDCLYYSSRKFRTSASFTTNSADLGYNLHKSMKTLLSTHITWQQTSLDYNPCSEASFFDATYERTPSSRSNWVSNSQLSIAWSIKKQGMCLTTWKSPRKLPSLYTQNGSPLGSHTATFPFIINIIPATGSPGC